MRGARHSNRRSRRTFWTLTVCLVVVLAAAVTVSGGYAWSLQHTIQSNTTYVSDALSHDAHKNDDRARGVENILLLGSDERPEGSRIKGQRADVIMLLHMNEAHTHAYVISFPRDLWVDVPGHGKAKLNAALAYGGLRLAVRTVEDVAGVPINHVAMIDFDGFAKLTKQLGGVTVDVSQSFTTRDFTFERGRQKLDGAEALSFVRERHAFKDGGFQRMRNQQAFLRGVLRAVLNKDTLGRPDKVSKLVQTLAPYLTVDSAFTPKSMVALGWSMRKITMNHVDFLTAPHGAPGRSDSGASIVKADPDAMTELTHALNNDSMADFA
ncbi:LCP family protein [Spelaeicoccus albus]